MAVNSVQRMLTRFREMDAEMDNSNEVEALRKANLELKMQLEDTKFKLEMAESRNKHLKQEMEYHKEQFNKEIEWYKEQRKYS